MSATFHARIGPEATAAYFRDLGRLAATGEMTPEAILAVMAGYAT
jgi:hypothetical protein